MCIQACGETVLRTTVDEGRETHKHREPPYREQWGLEDWGDPAVLYVLQLVSCTIAR